MTSQTPTTPVRQSLSLPSALLWASAFVLAGLVIMQAGKAAASGRSRDAALAAATSMDVVSRIGEFTTLTFSVGTSGSDDVLLVLDSRGEDLFTYRILNQRQVEFLGREDLKTVFATARRMGAGTGRR